jgi:hypothetical protein
VPAAAAAPGRLPASGSGRPCGPLSAQDRWLPAGLDGHPAGLLDDLTGPLEDLRILLGELPDLPGGPDLDDPVPSGPVPSDPAGSDLAASDPAASDLAAASPAPGGTAAAGPEVLKAGFWDRTCGDGAGFAAGGVADGLPPGPTLAGFAADAWNTGLARISDDELIGVLRAARRLASWATALELAAIRNLWRRRVSEEDAGDTGAADHVDAEIAAALTLTPRAADTQLDMAIALGRLPLTSAALAAGAIDAPRAKAIAEEVTGLTDEHAAAVEQAVITAAGRQTTGQLRAATRRAALSADPQAARKRKEEALREARVERWAEHAGTAALAGRDLPPAAVLAADSNLTALAKQLKAAGTPGTLDTLRAQVYLALLTGAPVTSLLPGSSGGRANPGPDEHAGDRSALASTPPPDFPGLGGAGISGRVNLTLPLATWLGVSDAPGHCAGYGPLDAAESRDLAGALARRAGNGWCLTFTDPDGRPVVHGCGQTGSPSGHRGRPAAGPRDGPAAATRDGPPGGPRGRPLAGIRDGPQTEARDRPATGAPGWTWTFTFTPLTGSCDHAWETPAYRPPRALRHLIEIRHDTCVFPGCRRPATQCDLDHTIAYEAGGRTCLCNLAPLCRRHHEAKQAPGWRLEQPAPGELTWTTPSGRRYTGRDS